MTDRIAELMVQCLIDLQRTLGEGLSQIAAALVRAGVTVVDVADEVDAPAYVPPPLDAQAPTRDELVSGIMAVVAGGVSGTGFLAVQKSLTPLLDRLYPAGPAPDGDTGFVETPVAEACAKPLSDDLPGLPHDMSILLTQLTGTTPHTDPAEDARAELSLCIRSALASHDAELATLREQAPAAPLGHHDVDDLYKDDAPPTVEELQAELAALREQNASYEQRLGWLQLRGVHVSDDGMITVKGFTQPLRFNSGLNAADAPTVAKLAEEATPDE